MLYFLFVLKFPTVTKFLGSWVEAGRALKGWSNIEGLVVSGFVLFCFVIVECCSLLMLMHLIQLGTSQLFCREVQGMGVHMNHPQVSWEQQQSGEAGSELYSLCLMCHTAWSVLDQMSLRGAVWLDTDAMEVSGRSKVEGLKPEFGWENCVMLILHSKAVKRQGWCFKLTCVFWNHLLHPH